MNKKEFVQKLKPCPFCGYKKFVISKPKKGMAIIRCKNIDCNVMLSTFRQTEDNAIKIWNTRF